MRPTMTFTKLSLAALACIGAASAHAQVRPDPASPDAKVPSAIYRSPFTGYRVLGEEPVRDWRASNDEVGRIGGWREYAREAQATEGSPAPAAAPKVDHGAHGVKK